MKEHTSPYTTERVHIPLHHYTTTTCTVSFFKYDLHLFFAVYDSSIASYKDDSKSPTITVHRDGIVVNNYQVPLEVTYFGREQLYWRYEHPDIFLYGCLQFHDHGHYFHGMYAVGSTAETTTFHAIQGVAVPRNFVTSISTSTCYDPTNKICSGKCTGVDSPGAGRTTSNGPALEIGYGWDPTGLPTPVFRMSQKDISNTRWKICSPCRYVFLYQEALHSDPASFPVSAGDITIANDSTSFAGSATLSLLELYQGVPMYNHCWKGQVVSKPKTEPIAIKRVEPTYMQKKRPADLLALCYASAGVDEDFKNMLKTVTCCFVKNHMPDWLKFLSLSTTPRLSRSLLEISQLPGADSFYRRFAMPYIIAQLCQQGMLNLPIDQALKVHYYFQHGLAKEPGYITQANALYHQAFVSKMPRLEHYLRDQKMRGQDLYWAKQLHKLVLGPSCISTFVATLLHGEGDVYHQLRDYGTLLGLLQPSGELLLDAYKKLYIAALTTLSENTSLMDVKDQLVFWVTSFTEGFTNWGDNRVEASTADRKIWEIANDFKRAVGFAGDLKKFATMVVDVMSQNTKIKGIYNYLYVVGSAVAEWFEEEFQEISSNLIRGAIAAVYVVVVMTSIHGLFKWEITQSMQSTTFNTSLAEFGINIMKKLPSDIASSNEIFKSVRGYLYSYNALNLLESLLVQIPEDGQWADKILHNLKENLSKHDTFVMGDKNILKILYGSNILKLVAPVASLIAVIAVINAFIKEQETAQREELFTKILTSVRLFKRMTRAAKLMVQDMLSSAGPLAILGVVANIVQFSDRPSSAHMFYVQFAASYIDCLPLPPPDIKIYHR